MKRVALFALMILAAATANARAVKVIQPLPETVAGADHVTKVEVTVSDSARKNFDALEQKAAEKRTAAKLPPADKPDLPRPKADEYATLPFARMLPLVIEDATTDWGLKDGRALKLTVQVDTLRTLDAGMALLLGSTDQLAGLISVEDAASGEKLGEFYVDVLNARAGLLGMAMRGSGVREKLAEEFAKHVCEVLSGRKSKTAKKG
ncbi:hypothetical protein [Sphingomonas sp. MMS24-J13]|uniref:hypothetical protein n=1 Tax=Sphingomonas sp. MMS24-J13 TaxID=3238686 RepID=UPI00384F2724